MKEPTQPLSDIWEIYSGSIEQAINQGLIDDSELADDYVWPRDLNFADFESEDVKRYVHERMTEIVDRIKTQGGLDPNLMAGYIFRSVLCGMLWQVERTGR